MNRTGTRIFRMAVFAVSILLLFSACSPARKVQKRGGYLMGGHSVKTDRSGINSGDLLNFAQPKPNRKFMGLIRPGIFIYDLTAGGKDRKLKRWIRKHIATTPVLLDSSLVDNSLTPMRVYLNNKGYFGADVARTIELKGAKAFVRYRTITKEPFRFGKIEYDVTDDSLQYFLRKKETAQLLVSGKQYDAYLMRDERERITHVLKEAGYYAFSREYILFEVDTTKEYGRADIKVRVENVRTKSALNPELVEYKRHQRYFINDIFVNFSSPEMLVDTIIKSDTIAYSKAKDSLARQTPDFYLIYKGELRIRPAALYRSLFITPGMAYNQQSINLTYNRLQNLGLSRFVSINLNPAKIAPEAQPTGISMLDCDIRMVRRPVSMINTELEATNAGGFVGLGAGVNYHNRNIFRGAETFRLKLRGGFEVGPDYGLETGEKRKTIFNSIEGGIETGIDFNTLLGPFKINRFRNTYRSKTTIALAGNYQQRTFYTRLLSNFSFGYDWYSSETTRHLFSPVDLSLVGIERDSVFTAFLNSMKDPRFLHQYTSHLIMAMRYSYIFNNQNLSGGKDYFFLRANFETAGNLLNLYSHLADVPLDAEGNFRLFKIRFAQYFRTDIDFRFYQTLIAKQQLAYRAAIGVGVPYGNSSVLPFEKAFFAGGANGLRGWPLRSVGPGEYYKPVKSGFERVGDFWLEANIEYRFPVQSFLNGSLFVDAGNVWLLKENEDFPGGKLEFRNLPKSIALDTGIGFRFDFSFFVFRIDGGLPVYDPGQLENNRWFRPGKFQLKNINWNFGIGYPF